MRLDKEKIEKIIDDAKDIYAKLELTHDLEHVLRVSNLAAFLAEKEGANVDVVKVSAWLHDIGYFGLSKQEMIEKDHHNLSAEMAREIMRKHELDGKTVDEICNCIVSHNSSRISANSPSEAKCLHDADKLDCVGVRGILRMFAWNLTVEPRGYSLSGYVEHLRKTALGKEKVLVTKTAKEVAKKWNKRLFELFDAFKDEMKFSSGAD